MCPPPSIPSLPGILSLLRKIPSLPGAAALLAAASVLRAAPGDFDPSFHISLEGLEGGSCRIIPAGDQFYIYNRWGTIGSRWADAPVDYLTRWNVDGTRDSAFKVSPLDGKDPDWDPPAPYPPYPTTWSGGIQNTVRDVHIREDGALLATGYFGWTDDSSSGNGSGTFSFLISPSGTGLPSVPASMENRGDANGCLPLRNGGFLLWMRSAAGESTLLRLKPDFSVDPGFSLSGFDQNIRPGRVLCELPDGGFLFDASLLVVPQPPPVNGQPLYSSHIRRLNPDGSLDTSFTNPTDFRCHELFMNPDGTILATGYAPAGNASIALARLHSDGTLDSRFNAPPGFDSIGGLMLQADGKILASGRANNTLVPLFRMNADGSLDNTFTLNETSGIIENLILMGDGQVLLEEWGSLYPRGTFVRVKNDPAVSMLEKTDNTTLHWRRGGSAPEVWRVTFEHRASDAAGWTPLGMGTRTAEGWELSVPGGIPVQGQIRARGWNPGNPKNSGWVEATLSPGISLNEWRQSHFGSADNTGDGADGADPDRDGISNLAEYLFGSDPKAPSASALPAWTVSGEFLECRFVAAAGISAPRIAAEWSTDPASPSWQTVEGQADGAQWSFRIPLSGQQRIFARLRISAPQG